MSAVLLKYLRIEKGLTIYDIADGLCVSPGTVLKWEQGEFAPSKLKLATLATLFEVSPECLLSTVDGLKCLLGKDDPGVESGVCKPPIGCRGCGFEAAEHEKRIKAVRSGQLRQDEQGLYRLTVKRKEG